MGSFLVHSVLWLVHFEKEGGDLDDGEGREDAGGVSERTYRQAGCVHRVATRFQLVFVGGAEREQLVLLLDVLLIDAVQFLIFVIQTSLLLDDLLHLTLQALERESESPTKVQTGRSTSSTATLRFSFVNFSWRMFTSS